MSSWNPQPPASSTRVRSAYFAGYSDGWYGYKSGSGAESAESHNDIGAEYRRGFKDGRVDSVKEPVSCKVGTQPTLILLRHPTRRFVGAEIEFRYYPNINGPWEAGVIDKVNDDGYFFVSLT
jgi:hypothetical protein